MASNNNHSTRPGSMSERDFHDLVTRLAGPVARQVTLLQQRNADDPTASTTPSKPGPNNRFSGTCNHVAAILFKVDFAWRSGINNPACTSKECEWATFGTKRKVEPKRVSEMTWQKPQFTKSGDTAEEGINPTVRKLFSPVSARSSSNPRAKRTLDDILPYLAPTFGDACIFQYYRTDCASIDLKPNYSLADDIGVGLFEEVSTSFVPEPLVTIAERSPSVDQFLETIPVYTARMVQDLEASTRGQATNQQWFLHRKGRITGSVAHSVLTRSRRLMAKKANIDNAPLLMRLLHGSANLDSSALKYGREMEPEARRKYVLLLKECGHKDVKVEDCGLFVDPDMPYLGASPDASPDGLVSCSCCGEGLLEVKCPFSILHTHPTSENLTYIEKEDQGYSLKWSHPYFTQVQLQMGVTKMCWCDLYVYTRHGHITIRVPFDSQAWLEIRECSQYFFRNFLAQEMVRSFKLDA